MSSLAYSMQDVSVSPLIVCIFKIRIGLVSLIEVDAYVWGIIAKLCV